ncbi:MAG: hypothetical protein R3C25_05850 [Hyphomonadaceae bacterium]
MLRYALAACALLAAAPAFAETNAPAARCEAMSFRVYFPHGSAQLDETAAQVLDLAARNVSECAYAELNVALDGASPLARDRGQSILAAASGRDWNAVRLEARPMSQRASLSDGPEYAEVRMTPFATSAAPAESTMARRSETGV